MSKRLKDDAPVLILHGTKDKSLVKPFQGKFLHEAYKNVGLISEYYLIEGAGHGGSMWREDPQRKLVLNFLDKHLKEGN